jgi:beta-lactamase superfamily II metal-dependent hydrolase
LERLTRREIDVWRTDLAGNITFKVSRTGEIEIVTQH